MNIFDVVYKVIEFRHADGIIEISYGASNFQSIALLDYCRRLNESGAAVRHLCIYFKTKVNVHMSFWRRR